MGTHSDPNKWRMPGWRIEQRYANNVLIGNWSEERHQASEHAVQLRVVHLLSIQGGSSRLQTV